MGTNYDIQEEEYPEELQGERPQEEWDAYYRE